MILHHVGFRGIFDWKLISLIHSWDSNTWLVPYLFFLFWFLFVVVQLVAVLNIYHLSFQPAVFQSKFYNFLSADILMSLIIYQVMEIFIQLEGIRRNYGEEENSLQGRRNGRRSFRFFEFFLLLFCIFIFQIVNNRCWLYIMFTFNVL